MLVTVNPHQSPGAVAADLDALRAPAVILDRQDWASPEIAEAARRSSRLVVVAGFAPGDLEVTHRATTPGADYQPASPGVAIQMLSSGTTGKPKRINLSYRDLEAGIWNVTGQRWARDPQGNLRVNTSPGLIYSPFGHIGGLWFLFYLACEARPFVLLERFNVQQWVAAVKQYRMRNTGLVPTAMRMVLEAGVPREDLASLVAIGTGTAPLPAEQWQEFETRYGIAVLPTYGSTEFAGAVVRWTIEDHRQFISTKRGAAGRAIPGNRIRIVDPETDEPLATGREGLVEISSNQLRGGEWVRTTDLGRLDEDGFLYILGRADGAINRGGFKILPDEIERVLRRHPAVRDAAALGLPDPRLGEIPVAAVEVRPGQPRPTEDELSSFAREHLVTYKAPARILVLDAFPRTASMKPMLPALRELFSSLQ
jgi:acyl-coenzyme A synthetase/AMP-(fatty) acid ligase